MQQHSLHTQHVLTHSQPVALRHTTLSNNVWMGSSVIVLPLLIVAGIVASRQYRAAALRRQIQKLEKLWELEFKGTTSS
jgi:hypothetical protein